MSSTHTDCDVFVVGAGPSGCECARRLAADGWSVTVAEEHSRPGEPVHCTGIISAHAYRAFDLPPAAVQSELDRGELTSPGGVTLRVDLNGTRAYAVDRKVLDLELATRARDAGADFSYRTRVQHARVDGSVVGITGTRAGKPWTARARAIVLASGAKSRLPRQLGMAAQREAAYGAQAELQVPSPPVMRVWVGQQLAPGGFGWTVPGKPGWSRVGVLTREKPREALRRLAHLALDGGSERLLEEAIRVHPVPAAPRCPTYGDRALSLGDAAGQVKMTTGGGVYYGMLAAGIAAEVLSEQLSKRRLSARDLSRYEELWQQLLGPEQRAGRILRRLATSVPDPTIDEIFRFAEARGLSHQLLDLVDFDWHARPGVGLALAMLARAPGEERALQWLRHFVG